MRGNQSFVAILGFEGNEIKFAPVIATPEEISRLKDIDGEKVSGVIPKNVLEAMLSSVNELEAEQK